MSLLFWKQVTKALQGLSPEAVIREASQPFSLALVGSADEVSAMEDWLVPPHLTPALQAQARRRLFPMRTPLTPGEQAMFPRMTARVVGFSAAPPRSAEISVLSEDFILFDPANLGPVISQLLERCSEQELALARHLPALRDRVIQGIIGKVARENAAFAALSAVPNVIPSPIELPWAIGEFASDTVVITANQIRMALLIAAASDAPVGFSGQRGQVASILGSAFGLRSLARELAGKLPGGGGLVLKGVIAYAGTVTMGFGLAHFHRRGQRFSRLERNRVYRQALEAGREVVGQVSVGQVSVGQVSNLPLGN